MPYRHDSGIDYFEQREVEERVRAELAMDPAARRIHLELADRYAAQRGVTIEHVHHVIGVH